MGGWSHENADKRLKLGRRSHTITMDPLYRERYLAAAERKQTDLKADFYARQAAAAKQAEA